MDRPAILLSVKPQFAEAILSGKKTVEFRKANFPKRVKTAVLYSTRPVGRIVGIADVKAVVLLSPAMAWRNYSKRGAIDKGSFDAYYAGARTAVCLKLGRVRRLARPVNPRKDNTIWRAPRSFKYLSIGDYTFLQKGSSKRY